MTWLVGFLSAMSFCGLVFFLWQIEGALGPFFIVGSASESISASQPGIGSGRTVPPVLGECNNLTAPKNKKYVNSSGYLNRGEKISRLLKYIS